MPQAEFLAWMDFYKAYPFDDLHRFHRPAALIASRHGKTPVREFVSWLQPDPTTASMSEADLNTLRAFGLRS